MELVSTHIVEGILVFLIFFFILSPLYARNNELTFPEVLAIVEGMQIACTGILGTFKLRGSLPPLDPAQDAKLLMATCNKSSTLFTVYISNIQFL